MKNIRSELVKYGKKIAVSGLVAGAGGNISAREGGLIWMKPSGFAMDEMEPEDLCGLELKTGRQVRGKSRPTSEFNMHLAIYRARPDVRAVFHTHSAWASGVITSGGAGLRPMTSDFRCVLGRVATVPYVTPTTVRLADAMSSAARHHETIFMVNHGVLAVGEDMRQAFTRCLMVEHSAIALVAASVIGRPRFLSFRRR